MYPLNHPTIDSTIDPERHHDIEGDIRDDDAQVLDEQFEAMPTPPVDHGGIAYEKDELPPVTRVLSRQVRFTSVDGIQLPDPLQVFSADRNRKECIIRLNNYEPLGSSDAVAVCFASDKGDCYNGNNILNNDATNQPEWRTAMHTGAVWLYAFVPLGVTPEPFDIILSVWVVTV